MSIEKSRAAFAPDTPMPRLLADFSLEAWGVEMTLFDAAMQDVVRLQKELLAFFDRRMTADAQAIECLVQCATPGTFVDLQASFWSGLVTDYAEIGQRGLSWLGDAVQHSLDEMEKRWSFSELAGVSRPIGGTNRRYPRGGLP